MPGSTHRNHKTLRRPDAVEGRADDPPRVTRSLTAGIQARRGHALAVFTPDDADGRRSPGLHADQRRLPSDKPRHLPFEFGESPFQGLADKRGENFAQIRVPKPGAEAAP